MILVFHSDEDDPHVWKDLLIAEDPNIDFHVYPDIKVGADEVEFALINPSSANILKEFSNLKGVISLFAGVDKILNFKEAIPKDVPIIRLISEDLTRGMSEFIVYHVIRYYRQFDQYVESQKKRYWASEHLDLKKRNIGIMGLGELGGDAARKLSYLGFNVTGWSRSQKSIEGVKSYAGEKELAEFLSQAHILVSLLPLTSETEGMINHRFIEQLPRGAFFINAARGQQVVQEDLISALDQGYLSGATLDVFDCEPLPSDHSFWSHPKITVTPHIASVTNPCAESAKWFVDNMRLLKSGRAPSGGIVDLDREY